MMGAKEGPASPMREWNPRVNPLFSSSSQELNGAEPSLASCLEERLCAPYRPSPVPLRSIGDVVQSLSKGQVQAVKVAPTTQPTNHPVLRVRYHKSSSAGRGAVYDSSICLPSGEVIPATTNMLAQSGLQWTASTPPWYEEGVSSVPPSLMSETERLPRSSSQSIRDRLQNFAKTFRHSRVSAGRFWDSAQLDDDDDHVRVSCFRRSDASGSSTTSNPLLPVTRSFRRGLSRISNLGSTPDVAALSRRATTPDTISSTPPLQASRPARSTISSLTSWGTADVQRSSDGGAVPRASAGFRGASRSTTPAAPSSFTFTTPVKPGRAQSKASLFSPSSADVYLDKVSFVGNNTPRDSVSPSRIAAQRNVKDSTVGSTANQSLSLNLQSRVPTASQACSAGQLSPCDSLSGPPADDDDIENPTQLLRDAYASQMGNSTQLLRDPKASFIGNPTQLLCDAYGSDMSFARSGRTRGISRQLNRLGMCDGVTVGMKTPRELRTAAVRRGGGDSCSIQLPHDSGVLGNSGDTGGTTEAQSVGLRRQQQGYSVPPPTSVSLPLKNSALRKRQQRRRSAWTQAHASGMWHGRTLADLNQLSKEWQDIKTGISTARSRTNSPARIRPPKGVAGNSQSIRLSVSRARRQTNDAEQSAELVQESSPLDSNTGHTNSPAQQRSKSLGTRGTRASLLRQNRMAAREENSGPQSATAAFRVTRKKQSSTSHNFGNPRNRPFVAANGTTNAEGASRPTPSVRTADNLDSGRRQSYHSKDVKRKQGTPRHVPANAQLIDARYDDVRYANTATKRVGRDPRPRRAYNSPDGRAVSKGLQNSSGKGAPELKQHMLQRTRPGGTGPVSAGSLRTRYSVAEQMKPTAQGTKQNAGGSSLTAIHGQPRALHTSRNGPGSLKQKSRMDSLSVGRGRADLPKRALSRGGDRRGVWR